MQFPLSRTAARCICSTMLVLATTAGFSAETAGNKDMPWYVPAGIMFQTAGFIGTFCIGAEYQFIREILACDIVYGFVPEGVAGHDHHLITLKYSLRFLNIVLGDIGSILPLYFGSSIIYCPHEDTFVIQPGHYPDDYYRPTALHFSLHIGNEIVLRKPSSERRYSFYVEVCTLYLYLESYFKNRPFVEIEDILSLALGWKILF